MPQRTELESQTEKQSTREDAAALLEYFANLDRVYVAFSGGVDSSVVAAAAFRSREKNAVAITADSPSVARKQLITAKRVASEIGIEHRVVATTEMSLDEYRRNDGSRCFFCKQTLYRALQCVVDHVGQGMIVSGTNADDLGDYRPGIRAGQIAGIVTPLATLGFTKSRVRALAKLWQLSVSASPASPCLSSRVAYGVEVTEERLQRIEAAEDWLHLRGYLDVRVRLHADDLARLEITPEQWPTFADMDQVDALTHALRNLGFKFVTLDLQGRRSGSLNSILINIAPPDSM